MGVFSRLTDIVNANINSLLDRAEDPEKMARLMIQEMEDTMVEVRSAAVKAIADRNEIERRLQQIRDGIEEWDQKAQFALSKNREDLARGALVAKRKLADQENVLEAEMVLLSESIDKYDEDLTKLQQKLDEAKTKRKSVEIRMKTAEKRVKMRETLYSGRVDDALSRYDNLERKIDELEADAESYELGRGKSLDQEFSDLAAENGVDEELEDLKKKLKKQKS